MAVKRRVRPTHHQSQYVNVRGTHPTLTQKLEIDTV
jgi:hypothetical protein